MKAPVPAHEKKRIEILWQYDVLDTPPEAAFDDLTSLAAQLCQAPIALITLVDETRQWFKSKIGLTASETARNVSFCAHAILQPDLCVVPDATRDERFADNPLVTAEPHIRFYAGAPLITPDGYALGTLCVVDRVPRVLSVERQQALCTLSRLVMTLLEQRRHSVELARNLNVSRQVEEALQASERRFRALLENSRDGIALVDSTGTIRLFPSPSTTRTLGYGLDELVGHRGGDLIHPDDLPQAQALFSELLQAPGRSVSIQLRCRHKDGSWRWLESTSKNLLADSCVQAIVVNYRDITECVIEEQALREGEHRLELFFSQSLDGFFFMILDEAVRWDDTVDKEGVLDYVFTHQRLTKVNDAMLDQYGARREQMIGRTPADFFAHDLRQGREAWRQMFDAGRLHTETEERRLDGTSIWLEGDYICLYDRDGRITGHFGIQRDVTDRRKTLEALRSSEAYARAIIESSLDMIIAVDQDRKIIEFNAAAERTFGYQREEVLGQSADFLYADAEAGRAASARVASQRQCVLEVWNRRKNGEVFPSLLSASVLRNAQGQALGAMGISRDISEFKRVQESLENKTQQLSVVAEAMEAFLDRKDWPAVSRDLLGAAIRQTASEYGFIGVVVEGPVLRILAHEGIRWDASVNRQFYEEALRACQDTGYLEFKNFKNLFGAVITSRQVVVANEPGSDPRSGGLPPGHPPLEAFLGVPILRGAEVVGLIGVANRPGGYTGQEQAQIEILAGAVGVLFDSYRRQQREAGLEAEREQMVEALRQAQADLEARVQKRTAELSETNALLAKQVQERLQAEAQIAIALREKEMLLREIYHRIKNNLQVVSSLIDLQANQTTNEKERERFGECQARIQSMALIHEQLYQGNDVARIDLGAYVKDLIESLIQSYASDRGRVNVQVEAEGIVFGIDTAIPCGLMINELIANALKHAFPGRRMGVIRLRLTSLAESWFELVVADDGVGIPAAFDIQRAEGLGLQLIHTLAAQLGGSVELRRGQGSEFRIRFREIKYKQRE